ncbi:MAG: hypothetical protein E7397_07425 [Ruminococcaceae bacterium]|nr:hypothetical protein [Oscillospiraceae bacterium]
MRNYLKLLVCPKEVDRDFIRTRIHVRDGLLLVNIVYFLVIIMMMLPRIRENGIASFLFICLIGVLALICLDLTLVVNAWIFRLLCRKICHKDFLFRTCFQLVLIYSIPEMLIAMLTYGISMMLGFTFKTGLNTIYGVISFVFCAYILLYYLIRVFECPKKNAGFVVISYFAILKLILFLI